jgi:hypothetical protein
MSCMSSSWAPVSRRAGCHWLQLTWSEDLGYAELARAARAGWLIAAGADVARFEQHRRVFSGQGSHDYAPDANLLGVVVGQTLQLVDEAGRARSVPLPFPEPVRAIKLDPAGARVALGTEQGLYVLSTTSGAELARSLTGLRIEPSAWRDNVVVALRFSRSAPEQAFFLLDTRSGASLTIGFANVQGAAAVPFLLASNGAVDAPPAVFAALRGGPHHDAPLPNACSHPGICETGCKMPRAGRLAAIASSREV